MRTLTPGQNDLAGSRIPADLLATQCHVRGDSTTLELYPDDVTQGSSFDTGDLNALTPQFKLFAAFQGDAVFQAPRRFFLQSQSGKQDIWSFGV